MTFCASPIDPRFFIWCSFLLNNSFCAVTFFSNVRSYRLEWCLQPRYSLHALLLYIEPSHQLLQYESLVAMAEQYVFSYKYTKAEICIEPRPNEEGRGAKLMTLRAWNPSTPHFRVIYFLVSADLADQLPRGAGGNMNKHFVFCVFNCWDQWKRKTEEFPEKKVDFLPI